MQPKPLIPSDVHPPRPVRHLCETCLNRDGCSLCADPDSAVHQCEEYDAGPTADRAPVLVSIPVSVPAAQSTADRAAPGLCANCELQNECTLPKARGGVWFCEEYQ